MVEMNCFSRNHHCMYTINMAKFSHACIIHSVITMATILCGWHIPE